MQDRLQGFFGGSGVSFFGKNRAEVRPVNLTFRKPPPDFFKGDRITLVIQAKRKGIGAIALTDHHTVKGIPSFLKAAQSAGVEGFLHGFLNLRMKAAEEHCRLLRFVGFNYRF